MAVETYHRDRYEEKPKDEKDDTKLKKRLKELYREFEEILCMDKSHAYHLIKKAVLIRDYHTHYNDEKIKSEVDKDTLKNKDNSLLESRDLLNSLLQLCFLREIGFNNQKIQNIVDENPSVKRVLKLDKNT